MPGPTKTVAMRVLERVGIPFQVVRFPEAIHDALGVAQHAGLPPAMVYKTLVVLTHDAGSRATGQQRPLLVMIAADRIVDLKKVARAVGVKRVEMAPAREAERLTGLKVGGISALALLDKRFRVYLDELARGLDEIVISAGVRGLNLRLSVPHLLRATGADWMEASRPGGGGGGATRAAAPSARGGPPR